MRANLVSTLGEENTKPIFDVMEQVIKYAVGMGQLVGGAIQEQNGKLRKMTLPQQMKALVPTIRGARDSDVDAALGLLEKGEARTIDAAMKLAVFERTQRTLPTPSPEARERAERGIQASTKTLNGVRPGKADDSRIPATPAEWKALRKREALASQKR